ncbi:MAG: hypothetical protein ACO3YZ_04710 [Candidatus Nanopelagicaceae bacterium]
MNDLVPHIAAVVSQEIEQQGSGGTKQIPQELLDENYPQQEYALDLLEDLGTLPTTLEQAYALVAEQPEVKVTVYTLQNNWRKTYLLPLGLHTKPWEVAILLFDLATSVEPNFAARTQWQENGWPSEISEYYKSKSQKKAGALVAKPQDDEIISFANSSLTPAQEEMMARILDVSQPTALSPEAKQAYRDIGRHQGLEAYLQMVQGRSEVGEQLKRADIEQLRAAMREITGEGA